MAAHLSRMRRLFSPIPLQSFHPDAAIHQLRGATEATPRPFRGLDMEKVQQFKFRNSWNPSLKFPRSGYQNDAVALPSLDAMTDREVAAFFSTADYMKAHSTRELLQYAKYPITFVTLFQSTIIICLVPFIAFVLYLQKFEPMEIHMDADDFYKDFKWNYFGGHLDHHAYSQYLEARRAVKWRAAEHDPRDWIPDEYKEAQ